jgi:hypothetical protein
MKKLILIIALLCISTSALAVEPIDFSKSYALSTAIQAVVSAGAAAASYALVASSGNSGTAEANAVSVAFGASTSSGHLLIAMLRCGSQTCPVVGVGTFEDNRGNTWTRHIIAGAYAGRRMAMYSAIAKDSGTVTVTATMVGADYVGMIVAAFSGVANNTPDGTPQLTEASLTNSHAGDLITSAAGIIVGFWVGSVNNAVTEDVNWTLIAERESDYEMSGCYRITTSSGTYNDGWTQSDAYGYSAGTVGFK